MPLWLAVILFIICIVCALILTTITRNKRKNIWLITSTMALGLVMLLSLAYIVLTMVFIKSSKTQPLAKLSSTITHKTVTSKINSCEVAASKIIDCVIKNATTLINDSRQDSLSKKTFPFEELNEYDSLSDLEKKLYDEMLKKIKNMEYFIYTAKDYGYDVLDSILNISGVIFREHPELEIYFRINEVFDGDVTLGLESLYFLPGDPSQTPVSNISILKNEVYIFEAVCNRIVKNMPKDLSTYDKYRYLATVISLKTDYDYEIEGGAQVGNAYGSTVGNKSICQGYSTGFYYLCKKADLFCKRVDGESNGVSHMWNIVKLDSGEYHIDITWADESGYPDSFEWFRYFMLTEDEILIDHIIW